MSGHQQFNIVSILCLAIILHYIDERKIISFQEDVDMEGLQTVY